MWGSLFALMSTGTRLAVLSLIACLILLVAREHVERIGARAAAEPIKAGAIGVLAQLLFLPLLIFSIVLLVVTIIGIPLLVLVPFAILALVLVLLVGFTSVAYHVGRIASGRFGWPADNAYLTAIVGARRDRVAGAGGAVRGARRRVPVSADGRAPPASASWSSIWPGRSGSAPSR